MFDVSITIPDLDFNDRPKAAEAARRFLGNEIFNHRLQFNVRGDGWERPITLAPLGLELPRMLVLSTSHITRQTSELLQLKIEGTLSTHEREALPIVFAKGEYGYLLPLTDTREIWNKRIDLATIRDVAETNGCTWIMLDRDADTIEGLLSFDW